MVQEKEEMTRKLWIVETIFVADATREVADITLSIHQSPLHVICICLCRYFLEEACKSPDVENVCRKRLPSGGKDARSIFSRPLRDFHFQLNFPLSCTHKSDFER